MKKMIFLMMMFMGAIFTGAFAGDDSLEKVKREGQFIVGLDDNFAPMGFRDEKGEIVGFDIDLAKEIAKRMGVKVVFEPRDWDGIIFDLRNKKIDMIWNGLTITEGRERQIAFSKPYFDDSQIIIVKRDSAINKLEELKDKTVGLQMGSSSYFAFEKTPVFKEVKEIKKYGSNVETLLDLEAGRVQGVVMDSVVGRYYIAKKDGFRVLDETLSEEKMGVGMRKEDKSLKNEIDRVLDEMKADGTFDTIYKKWFGKRD